MWRREGSFRVWALGVALCIALGSIGVLVYEAVGLERSHRAVAERVLQDYSVFAADQFSRLASERLRAVTRSILAPVACGSSSQARLRAAVEHTARAAAEASCVNPTAIDGFFELDPVSREVLFTTGSIAASVREAASSIPSEGSFAFRLLSVNDLPLVAGYWTDGIAGGEERVVGFVAPVAILRSVFDEIVKGEHLLPGSLWPPLLNREYLSIDVRDADGTSVYRSGPAVPTFAKDRPVGSAETNMQIRLAIGEAAAERLIIGGVPRSRLPVLLSLLAVSIGLIAIGTWQMHREQRLARLRVDFVRSASHELRTPLAQIRLFTDTLQLGRVRSWSEVVRSLDFVDQQTRRLAGLVENMLAFAQGRQRRRANLEPIELGAFLADTVQSFQPVASALGQELRIESCDRCVVRSDRNWLTQIVLNLLDNATKYGPAGQTITLRAESDADCVRIAVEDQGPGIPSNARKRIFAPFVRLSRENEQRTGGTGIGLAVSADLAAAMNGRIWADESAQGARFVVELPVDRMAQDQIGRMHSHVA
jgi:signal transduction histidine kinase